MSPYDPKDPLPFFGLGTEEALRAVADLLPDALFTTDLEGRVTYWNRAAERITGWSAADALGRDCSILAGDAHNGCVCGIGPLKCGLALEGRSSKTCTLRAKDGRHLSIVKNAVVLASPEGEPIGALETFTAAAEVAVGTGCDWRTSPRPQAANDLVGDHLAMRELRETIDLVARSTATVMILGESGTGKGSVADAIQRASQRADAPYVRVSCSAHDEGALERELFGDAGGRPGSFLEANGGTLLLDELGDLSPRLQAKLLHVVERRELPRAGDAAPVRLDVRLLCTTHGNLKAMVEAGRFRADLYFRLAVFPLRVPPLREHLEDLPRLAEALLARAAEHGAPRPSGLTPGALTLMRAHPWLGNVRELQNVLEFAALRAGAGLVDSSHLPEEFRRPPPAAGPGVGTTASSRESGGRSAPLGPEQILAMVERCGGNRAEAARRLGISRVTLWKRLKQHGGRTPPEDG
jgi:DNA-binding NtrC family response regulator